MTRRYERRTAVSFMQKHNANDLITLFNDLFSHVENTVLIGGVEEPLYLPVDDTAMFNRVYFTRDYFASALHEIAHWCLAGVERRQLVDYGYWYYPEGRSLEQQRLFERAEVKPQAIECLFARAAQSRFLVSKDDFSNRCDEGPESFETLVFAQAERYLLAGLPVRAALFRNRLLEFYGV